MSNTERQRRFRERNPGYYARLNGRKREAAKACALRLFAAERAAAAHKEPLMLPAPVQIIEIPGLTTLSAAPAALSPTPLPSRPDTRV